MFFPRGNNVRGGGFSSIYLELCTAKRMPYGTGRNVDFELKVINHKDRNEDFIKGPEAHEFTSASADWGFREFFPLAQLKDPDSGFIDANQRISFSLSVKYLR
jgi:hypothetical protein